MLALVVVARRRARRRDRDHVLPGVEVARRRPRRHDRAGGARRGRGPRAAGSRATPIHAHAGNHDLVARPDGASATASTPRRRVRAARRDGRSAQPDRHAARRAAARAAPRRRRRSSCTTTAAGSTRCIDAWVGATGKGLVDGGLRFEGAQVAEIRAEVRRRHRPRRRAKPACSPRSATGQRRRSATLTHRPTTPAIDAAEVAAPRALARRLLASPVQIVAGADHAHPHARRSSRRRCATADRRLAARAARRPAALRAALGAGARRGRDAAEGRDVRDQRHERLGRARGRRRQRRPRTASRRRSRRGRHHVAATLDDHAQPARTTEWAQKLNITELVSSYTTDHPCCQPRVTNIHRARRHDQRHDRGAGRDVLPQRRARAAHHREGLRSSRPASAPTSSSRTRSAAA